MATTGRHDGQFRIDGTVFGTDERGELEQRREFTVDAQISCSIS